MIELHDNPEALLEADHGDRFLLGGREVVVSESGMFSGTVFLTTADSGVYTNPDIAKRYQDQVDRETRGKFGYSSNEGNIKYTDAWIHVRASDNFTAVFTAREMVDMIRSREYHFG